MTGVSTKCSVQEGVGHISAIDTPTQRGVAYRYSATHTVGL